MKQRFAFVLLLLAGVMAVSCLKDDQFNYSEAKPVEVVGKQTAMRNFSVALSKVVCTNESAREFLKAEALKRVDNDYDIFYPFVKNQPISDGCTLRDLLVNELGGEAMMEKIEKMMPTLTVYVSDVTWLDPDGFCAEKWDTSLPQAAVSYEGGDGICHELYSNGYYLGKIEPGTIPGGPVLIVKENERIVASVPTKTGDVTYSFVSDVFDGSKKEIVTKNNRHTGKYTLSWIAGQEPEDNSDIMSADVLNALNPEIIKAYNYFKDDSYALQNDYIYYGMTPESPVGRLRNDVRSKIVRFKISPRAFEALFDDKTPGEKECNFVNSFETDDNGKGYKMQPSIATIYSKLWTEGALEIHVNTMIADKNSQPGTYADFYYNVKAKDLFTLKEKSIKKEQWGAAAFKWYITWKYTIVSRDEKTLVSKWYYPEYTPDLPVWDLVGNSSYFIIASEKDAGTTTTKTYTAVTKKASATTTKLGIEGNAKDLSIKGEFGWTNSDETAVTSTTTLSWTEGSDDMASLTINYRDKYIESQVSPTEYKVKSYETERFTVTILPYTY